MKRTIKVLVVDDSAVAREFLQQVLGADDAVAVAGTARDGLEAVERVAVLRPDVITMDLHMPRMDGLEAARVIMERHPTPIVMVTADAGAADVATTFRAMEAGALTVLTRPPAIGHPNHQAAIRELLQTVKSLSEVKMVRRWPRPASARDTTVLPHPLTPPNRRVELVAMGASTGGPMALQEILSALPRPFHVPILIVQHLAPGFVDGFVQWLEESSRFPVCLARDGGEMEAGRAYVAPDSFQMSLSAKGRLRLADDPPEMGLRPSASCLFRSVAKVCGAESAGVLLSGMGTDGAEGLKCMQLAGAVTIAQDAASSVVHGMPLEAIRLKAARHVLPPEGIAALLSAIFTKTASARATGQAETK